MACYLPLITKQCVVDTKCTRWVRVGVRVEVGVGVRVGVRVGVGVGVGAGEVSHNRT